MDHSLFEMMIQKHIDNALSPAEEERLQQHLEECPDCAGLLRDLSRLDSLLSAELTEVDPPEDFVSRVMAALPADTKKPKRRRFYLIWGSVAAAAVLLAAAVSGLFHQAETLLPPPQVAFDEDEEVLPELQLPNSPVVADSADETASDADAEADPSTGDSQKENDVDISPNSGETVSTEPDHTYSGEHDLPSVASGSYSGGTYTTVTLASVANCDALRPQVSGSVVTFYIYLDNSYLQWQVSADGSGNAVFLGECDGLPALPGTGQYHCDEAGSEWYSASYGSTIAENTDFGLLLDGEVVAYQGGGYLISWADDGSKVFFTDRSGHLYLYYPVEDLVLDVASSVSSAVWYGSNSIVMSAYDGATGYYSIFRISVP